MSFSDDMLNGMFCSDCGFVIGDAVGFPRKCEQCETPKKPKKNKPKKKKERVK